MYDDWIEAECKGADNITYYARERASWHNGDEVKAYFAALARAEEVAKCR